jgi:hypothetical protein
MGTYRVAQICINGHVINDSADEFSERNKKFCSYCGQPTIMNCPSCKESIRGFYYVSGVISLSHIYSEPSFCHNCGKPYPWTESKLNAAQELISEDERLSKEDKETLSLALPDLVTDTPKTQLAATRFKKLISKAVSATGEGLKQILVDIVSESAKKMLWP